MGTSKFLPHDENNRRTRVAIIGAGLAGLAVANGLMKDPAGRYDVQIFERDTIAFDSERGGYQLRLALSGLNALKTLSTPEVWSTIRDVWSEREETAPSIVEPVSFRAVLRLADYHWYPKTRAIPRLGLRRALLRPMLAQERVHFNHTFRRFEVLPGEGQGVRLHFEDQDPQDADILIAADGSNSQVNRQAGINNKIKLKTHTLVQSRGRISESIRHKLPESLVKNGPVLYFGGNAFGYASIYHDTDDPSYTAGGEDSYTLFWSILVDKDAGDGLIAKGGSDPRKMLPHLIEFVRNELGLGEALPYMIESATEQVRIGLVTSSFQPETDWRNGDDRNARVILLGDAMHPMPPTRGMGANQALTDAANLVDLFNQTPFNNRHGPSDAELGTLVRTFEQEMFKRAFNMVKTSEAVTALDLKKRSSRMLVAFVGMVMTVVGWYFSVLEFVGLRTPHKNDYITQKTQ